MRKNTARQTACSQINIARIGKMLSRKAELNSILRQAASDFGKLIDQDLPRRPLVGINGEIFLRSHDFSNCNLVRECEKRRAGGRRISSGRVA